MHFITSKKRPRARKFKTSFLCVDATIIEMKNEPTATTTTRFLNVLHYLFLYFSGLTLNDIIYVKNSSSILSSSSERSEWKTRSTEINAFVQCVRSLTNGQISSFDFSLRLSDVFGLF